MKNFSILTLAVSVGTGAVWAFSPALVSHFQTSRLYAQTGSDKAASASQQKKKADPKAASAKPGATPPSTDTSKKTKSQKADDPAAAAAKTLKQARTALDSFHSIQAEIRQTIVVGNRRVKAHGRYFQLSKLKRRIELEIKLGTHQNATTGSLLQVSNGQTLWTQQRIGNKPGELPRVTRRNVRQILNTAKEQESISEAVLVQELGMGGLPGLLASLEKAMTFSSVEQETIKGKTFTVLKGTWNKELMELFKRPAQGKPAGRLPQHVPDAVHIYLDPAHKMFPRRILYWKHDLRRDVLSPMLTIDFTNIKLNVALDESLFEYQEPEKVIVQDITDEYVRRLTDLRSVQSPPPQSGAAK